MANRRYVDDVSIDRYEDRRDYASRGGRRVYEDQYVDEESDYRRSAPVRERESQREVREVLVRDEVRDRPGSTPAFLREDYGRTTAGPVVLRAREREEFDYVPRPRRRSPSPEIERKVEKEKIIIRERAESESRPPPRLRERDREVDREEIIIRRDERDVDRRPPPPPPAPREREREEIIIRRDERDRDGRPGPPRESREEIIIHRDEDDRRSRYDVEFDDTISRRGDYGRRPPKEADRDEIIIRRSEQTLDPGRYDDYALTRPKSRERARSRARRSSSSGSQEIIIRQEEREGRNRERQEIIIRKHSRSRSPTASVVSALPPAPPEPQTINAPTIHQEVITHHRHIDHGFEVAIPTRPRPITRPPSPPSPPLSAVGPRPPRARSEERIEISRTQTRNGRTENENIVIDRNEGARSVAPYSPPPPPRDYYDPPPPRREAYRDYDRDVQEEGEYYNSHAMERAYIGEAYRGATKDWALVDVPPGTNRVRMDGAGGGAQEITWQRYNGVRRSKFMPEADERYGEIGRPAPLPAPTPLPPPLPVPAPVPASNGEIGRRFGRMPDPKDGLWTEITKDLVIKEAIQEMGYEYEETDDFYYIIAYLRYEDVARLVGLSEDIRKDRKKRIKEMEWENRVLPPIVVEEPPRPLMIEPPPPPRPRQEWDREEERYIEREVVYRGGRPPPPPGWARR
ncbi:hypothetical protein LTR67_009132 [Exophiala xenobiotica]